MACSACGAPACTIHRAKICHDCIASSQSPFKTDQLCEDYENDLNIVEKTMNYSLNDIALLVPESSRKSFAKDHCRKTFKAKNWRDQKLQTQIAKIVTIINENRPEDFVEGNFKMDAILDYKNKKGKHPNQFVRNYLALSRLIQLKASSVTLIFLPEECQQQPAASSSATTSSSQVEPSTSSVSPEQPPPSSNQSLDCANKNIIWSLHSFSTCQ